MQDANYTHTTSVYIVIQLPSLCHLTTAAHCTQQSCPDWTLPAALQSWDHYHPPYLGTGCAHTGPVAHTRAILAIYGGTGEGQVRERMRYRSGGS